MKIGPKFEPYRLRDSDNGGDMATTARHENRRVILPRIVSKIVEIPGPVDTPCWQWTGAKDNRGYGNVKIQGHVRKAHRVVYEWLRGPIPAGLEGDHLCRNRACVRPDHIELVTHAENGQRGDGSWMSGERQRGKTRCLQGHEYTPANTYIQPSTGGRCCRACDREKKAALRATRRRAKHSRPG